MTSKELVKRTLKGEDCNITPVYGWLGELNEPITKTFGSISNFEDKYKFDMAHIFGGPSPYSKKIYDLIEKNVEITPEIILDIPFNDINKSDYDNVIPSLNHHNQRNRFCYVQANGIFESLNSVFGIENHLMYMALYYDELKEIYSRLADWNIKQAEGFIELGVDGVHVSDDWGAQQTLMFSPNMFVDMIYPNHKKMIEKYKKYDVLTSLHSDGCVTPVLDYIKDIGYDFIHPWQENANMPYSLYLDKYQDCFGILGGVCVQSTIGFGKIEHLVNEINRVFSLLKGKRWVCCSTHFIQNSCSMEELTLAYDLILKLANK